MATVDKSSCQIGGEETSVGAVYGEERTSQAIRETRKGEELAAGRMKLLSLHNPRGGISEKKPCLNYKNALKFIMSMNLTQKNASSGYLIVE